LTIVHFFQLCSQDELATTQQKFFDRAHFST
jgi:hypothetical protein